MQKIPLRHFQGIFMCSVAVVMMFLITACSSSGLGNAQPTTTTGSTTTPTSVTQASPGVTQPAGATSTPVAFKAGGISFIGPVKSSSSNSLSMSAPDGQTYTLAISAQTDLSNYNNAPPPVGASVNMDSVVNPDGRSFTASVLKPAVAGDPDLNVIAYSGFTTSAVGSDRVIHFTVGIKAYTFTIPTTAVLTDFGSNAQSIAINTSVKVKVQFPSNAIVSIGNGP
jgi:hypothetical protein